MKESFHMEKKWLFPLIVVSTISIFFVATSFNMGIVSSIHQNFNSILFILPSRIATNQTVPEFVETKITPPPPPPLVGAAIPRFAYLISGSKGDLEKLWRTLHALYHPLNHYIVHLDLESPLEERLELASRIEKQLIFTEVGNVFMIQKANMVTYRGPTMVANTLHACAILLKRSKDWDWFINLSASDYPLVTQDDLLYTFSDLDRRTNFIEHTSYLGWKLDKRAMPLIIDPGLYMSNKSDVFWVGPKRTLPTAFKLFTVISMTNVRAQKSRCEEIVLPKGCNVEKCKATCASKYASRDGYGLCIGSPPNYVVCICLYNCAVKNQTLTQSPPTLM